MDRWWLLILGGECEAWIQSEPMAADADLLAAALELDLVDADDFAR